MRFLTTVCSFAALGSAGPAKTGTPWMDKRQAGDAPAYEAHTINQLVCRYGFRWLLAFY